MIQERRHLLGELFVYHRDVVRPAGQKAQKARALRNSHVKAFHRRYATVISPETLQAVCRKAVKTLVPTLHSSCQNIAHTPDFAWWT